MNNTSTKIIFFGTEDFSLSVLNGLIEADYEIVAVVTKPDSKKGRGQQYLSPAVKVLATQHNIPVWQPEKLKDIEDDIRKLAPVMGILVSFGKIIPQSTINLFTPGIINVHPSLLPKYRGPSPIESAIMNGDKTTGVSIMQLSAGMDAGPVYTTREYPLKGNETRPRLYQALATEGTTLLLEVLPRIIDGTLTAEPQDGAGATYCRLLQKEDAFLDPAVLTASEAERHVRAYAGFPKSKITLSDGQNIIITKAHTDTTAQSPLDKPFKDGLYLCIDELIAPSGRTMDAAAFLRGYTAA